MKKITATLLICLTFAFCASAQSSQTKIQKAREKDPQYQYNLGLFFLNQNNLDEAMKYLDKSLSINPQYYLAWNAVGLVHSMRGDLEESVKAFEKCLAIDPQFTEARNNLGMLYQEMNLLDKAEIEYRKAVQDLNYQSRELPYFNLAKLYVLQERLEDAFENIQKAVQINPRYAPAYNLRGYVFEKRDNWTEAVTSYETAAKLVPDELLFSYNLGVAYFKIGEFAKAKEIFLKISAKVTDLETKEKITQYLKAIGDRDGSRT